jgi:hypothetical protein
VQGRTQSFEPYRTMLRHPQTSVMTADTLSAVLLRCIDSGDVGAALQTVHDANMMGVPLHLTALSQLVTLLQDLGLHDAAMHIRRALPEQQPR